MKFLIGLIIGGVLTVIAAERLAGHLPDGENWRPQALLAWIEAAADGLQRGSTASEDRSDAVPARPEFVGAETETDATFIDAPVDPLAANLQQPASQLDGLEPLPPVDGPEPRPLADRPEAAPLAGEPESILPGEGPDPSADLRASRRPETIQQVWVPFRSQTSAEGFARRLSDETQHPFGIDRRGPGRYQVFFAYVDEDERQRLLEQVRPLLGTAAP